MKISQQIREGADSKKVTDIVRALRGKGYKPVKGDFNKIVYTEVNPTDQSAVTLRFFTLGAAKAAMKILESAGFFVRLHGKENAIVARLERFTGHSQAPRLGPLM